MGEPLNNTLKAQIVIVGGGAAGLWLLNRLLGAGYDAVLLESRALGAGQTLASQGIIHGGLKYALNGVLTPASSAIADMPARWRHCLEGTGEVDLRGCRLTSPSYYMWSGSSYRSRLKSFLGSKALRGRITALDRHDWPTFFQNDKARGTLYQLEDFVIDTGSLIETLTENARERLFRASSIDIRPASPDEPRILRATGRQAGLQLIADRYILCAGEGNEALLTGAGEPAPAMQRRPLHMVAVRHRNPLPVQAHCIGNSFGTAPRLTITSHSGSAPGEQLWYTGGALAEHGVERDERTQHAAARDELLATFPWLDLKAAHWRSVLINRAEPRVHDLQRPDTAYLHARQDLFVAWPVKLALCPDLGDQLMTALDEQRLTPRPDPATPERFRAAFDKPELARPPWETG